MNPLLDDGVGVDDDGQEEVQEQGEEEEEVDHAVGPELELEACGNAQRNIT